MRRTQTPPPPPAPPTSQTREPSLSTIHLIALSMGCSVASLFVSTFAIIHALAR